MWIWCHIWYMTHSIYPNESDFTEKGNTEERSTGNVQWKDVTQTRLELERGEN
jgi:hypothetical protein